MSTGQTKIRSPLWENEDSEFPTGKSEFSSLVHASDTLNQLLNNYSYTFQGGNHTHPR